jgi:hypothetical protein
MRLVFAGSNLVLKVWGSIIILSFVYYCDTKEGATAGKEGLVQAIIFFFMSVKKHDNNPIGPFVLDHLKERAEGLYNHLMKDSKNEDFIAEKITQDIDQHFSGVYNLFWIDTLNHWLVDFDII